MFESSLSPSEMNVEQKLRNFGSSDRGEKGDDCMMIDQIHQITFNYDRSNYKSSKM